MVKIILRIEALAVLLLSLYCYQWFGGDWLLFFLLLLLPDIGMLGYLKNTKLGSITYNLFHTYLLGIGVIVVSILFEQDFITSLGFIQIAHVGMDRLMGFGLKYPTHFKDTHMQKV